MNSFDELQETCAWILTIPIDPEEEDSPLYETEVLNRALLFLVSLQDSQPCLPQPGIHPGGDGSIDFLWEEDERRVLLLLNYPVDPREKPTFYGKGQISNLGGTLEREEDKTSMLKWLISETQYKKD